MALRVILSLVVAVACGEPDRAVSRGAGRDSTTDTLRDPTPLIGADSLPFEGSALDASVSYDGQSVLLDPAEGTVSVFDSTGRLAYAVGGKGGGPGEVRSLGAAFLVHPDTLAVYDPAALKILLFAKGRFIDTLLDVSLWPRGGDFRVNVVGRFGDGRWVMAYKVPWELRGDGAFEYTDSTEILAGRPPDLPVRVATLPSQRRAQVVAGNARFAIGLQDVAPAFATICDSGLVVQDSGGVHYLATDGRELATIPLDAMKLPLPAEQRAWLIERVGSGIPPGRGVEAARDIVRGWLASVERVVPYVQLDVAGRPWVQVLDQRRSEMALLDAAGEPGFAVALRAGIVAVGTSRVIAYTIDRETELISFALYGLGAPPAASKPVGVCQSRFGF